MQRLISKLCLLKQSELPEDLVNLLSALLIKVTFARSGKIAKLFSRRS